LAVAVVVLFILAISGKSSPTGDSIWDFLKAKKAEAGSTGGEVLSEMPIILVDKLDSPYEIYTNKEIDNFIEKYGIDTTKFGVFRESTEGELIPGKITIYPLAAVEFDIEGGKISLLDPNVVVPIMSPWDVGCDRTHFIDPFNGVQYSCHYTGTVWKCRAINSMPL
jgi:hypothetical protein